MLGYCSGLLLLLSLESFMKTFELCHEGGLLQFSFIAPSADYEFEPGIASLISIMELKGNRDNYPLITYSCPMADPKPWESVIQQFNQLLQGDRIFQVESRSSNQAHFRLVCFYSNQHSKLKIKPHESETRLEQDKFVSFPNDMREPGEYMVEKITSVHDKESGKIRFYKASGAIRRLIPS
jgi:hypothetical protein